MTATSVVDTSALAIVSGHPLLFVGDDFTHTDVLLPDESAG
jgi:uncharacterized protein with PIN domain